MTLTKYFLNPIDSKRTFLYNDDERRPTPPRKHQRKREKGETTMKTIRKTLSIRNGIVRNSASDTYYSVKALLLDPVTFVRFLVDLIDNH